MAQKSCAIQNTPSNLNRKGNESTVTNFAPNQYYATYGCGDIHTKYQTHSSAGVDTDLSSSKIPKLSKKKEKSKKKVNDNPFYKELRKKMKEDKLNKNKIDPSHFSRRDEVTPKNRT